MSGFHIHCGSWHGSDKGGNAFPEVINELQEFVEEVDRDIWSEQLMRPMVEQERSAADEDAIRIEISQAMMDLLREPLQRYYAELSGRLGFPDAEPGRAGERRRDGDLGRLVCAQELLQAYEICKRIKSPVVVFWS